MDTVVFDTVITNNGEAYNAETGECEVSQRSAKFVLVPPESER